MEEKIPVGPAARPNPTKVATKWALINAFIGIILTYVFEFMDLAPDSGLKYLSYVPFIVFLFLTQKEFRDEQGGYISFGTAFSAGFRYAVFTGLVTALFVYLYVSVLSPDVFEKNMEAQRAALEQKGMSDGDIDKAMKIGTEWGPIMGAFGAAILYAIFGAIFALIGAAIFKKEKSPYDIINEAEDPTV